jgi:hypothetical protein
MEIISSHCDKRKGRAHLLKRINIVTLIYTLMLLTGCVTVGDINAGFRRVDRMWQLEYQKTEDAFRYRVVDANYTTVFHHVRKTFIDLGIPVQNESIEKGTIIAQCDAPTPLTKEEWKKVAETENPKIKQAGGWMFRMRDDPKGYIVTVGASMRQVQDKTLVLLDYKLDNPKYRQMGFLPCEYAPPLAVQIGAMKFWTQLEKRLQDVNLPAPRIRIDEEKKWEI